MEAFTVRDLRERTGDLIRGAEQGHLAIVTKHGNPVFVAVPFDESVVREGINVALAVHLFAERMIGLAQAAKLARVTASEMMDLLAMRSIPLAAYNKDELADELAQFD